MGKLEKKKEFCLKNQRIKVQLGPIFRGNCLFNHRGGPYFELLVPSVISYSLSPSAPQIASAGPSSLCSCKSQPGLLIQAQWTPRCASSNISTAAASVSPAASLPTLRGGQGRSVISHSKSEG